MVLNAASEAAFDGLSLLSTDMFRKHFFFWEWSLFRMDFCSEGRVQLSACHETISALPTTAQEERRSLDCT